MTPRSKYAISMLAAAGIFGVANLFNFLRPVKCWDCFFPYGTPFTLFQEGGEGGGRGFVWGGVAGDALVILASGMVVGLTWVYFSGKRPN